ncbi:MAG: fused MFS/spermidine synthase [Myxococcales bacterium]|nr:fused MFS/spermidine synthase [Myxococcales bacterium]
MAFALLSVALTGFVALSYEIIWYRAYAFASGNHPTGFGLLLGFYLAGIAIGSLASRFYCHSGNQVGNPKQIRALAVYLLIANVISFLVVPCLAWMVTFTWWIFSFGLVWLAATLLGATLPLISHFAVKPDHKAGARLSYLYLANIVGSAAGSFLTGFVLFDTWPLEGVALFQLCVGVLIAAGMYVYSGQFSRVSYVQAVLTAGILLGGCSLAMPTLYGEIYEKMQFGANYDQSPKFTRIVENRHGVITVTSDSQVYGGGAYDGRVTTDLVDDQNWIVRAYAISAFHANPRRVLMVGMATGAWAQVIAHMPGVETLTVVEINPGYLEIIRHYPEVQSLLTNPKVEIVIDDGRRWLQRNPHRQFDVIVQNTTWHWRAHSTNILSKEYLELTKSRMDSRGVLVYNTTWSDDAQRTAVEVFPFAVRLFNCMVASGAPVVWDDQRLAAALTAWAIDGQPVLNLSVAKHRTRLEQVLKIDDTMALAPRREGVESVESILSRTKDAVVITDDNMACEWAFLRSKTKDSLK